MLHLPILNRIVILTYNQQNRIAIFPFSLGQLTQLVHAGPLSTHNFRLCVRQSRWELLGWSGRREGGLIALCINLVSFNWTDYIGNWREQRAGEGGGDPSHTLSGHAIYLSVVPDVGFLLSHAVV